MNIQNWEGDFDQQLGYMRLKHPSDEEYKFFIRALLVAQSSELKERQSGILMDAYVQAAHVAAVNRQLAGEKKNYYITIEQLCDIMLALVRPPEEPSTPSQAPTQDIPR